MFCHQFESEPGSDGRGPCAQSDRIQLANKGNMSHGIFEVTRTKIKVVHGKSLLEDRRIGTLGDGHQHGVGVSNVVPTDHVRTVSQSLRMLVRGGTYDQSGVIHSPRG